MKQGKHTFAFNFVMPTGRPFVLSLLLFCGAWNLGGVLYYCGMNRGSKAGSVDSDKAKIAYISIIFNQLRSVFVM